MHKLCGTMRKLQVKMCLCTPRLVRPMRTFARWHYWQMNYFAPRKHFNGFLAQLIQWSKQVLCTVQLRSRLQFVLLSFFFGELRWIRIQLSDSMICSQEPYTRSTTTDQSVDLVSWCNVPGVSLDATEKKDFSLACHWVHSCVSAACASVSADNEEHHWNLWTAHHWNLCTRFDAMSRHDWHCRESLARRICEREKRDQWWVLVHDPQSVLRTSNRKFKKPGP